MKRKQTRFSKVLTIASAFVFAFSCRMSSAGETQREFRDDSYFFLGLQAADAENEEKALQFFKIARDSPNSTDLIARRSAESLTMIGNVAERNEAARFIAKKYNDDSAILVAAREFYKQGEKNALIELTENLNFATAPNELVKIRLNAMLEQNDSRFEHEYFLWTISRALSEEHLEFYQKFLANKITTFRQKQQLALALYESQIKAHQNEWREKWQAEHPDETLDESLVPKSFDDVELQEIELPVTNEQLFIDFRSLLYRKNYSEAYRRSFGIIGIYERQEESSESDFGESLIRADEQILSDIGKAHLYGTDSFKDSALFFETLARRLSDEQAYYAHFYAARLWDRAGNSTKSTYRFRAAIASTEDSQKIDTALWYLLSAQQKLGAEKIVKTLNDYAKKVGDREYFDDFFEKISFDLLSKKKWHDYVEIWKAGKGAMSDEIASRFAYISGRILEEKLATDSKIDSETAFKDALLGAGSFYYKVCALERLGMEGWAESDFAIRNVAGGKEDAQKSGADLLLAGYAAFGFPARIYPEWLLNRKNLLVESSISASNFLFNCGKHDSKYNLQSLRIADRTKNITRSELPTKLLNLSYPQFFSELISKVCAENSIDEPMLYALVRTESFFEPTVSSSAGANGLTQLMEATAKDEARKLKLGDDWNILDPETNLRMGSHYLASLISRVDGNIPILALFAYNGGLTNVRNWLKKSKREWGKKPSTSPAGLPMDLFLETLPFKETRGYGRQLVASASLYGFLYYGIPPAQTVRKMLYGKTESLSDE